ncbi:unnamed protein product [Rotaria socialis]
MFSFLIIFLCNILLCRAAILQCDFEAVCNDFVADGNWGLTDGLHPQPINHDHTLNTSAGHYLFYNPQGGSRSTIAEIKTSDWLQPQTDRAICFQMWYYTSRLSFPFNIQLVQGDDGQLVRIAATIKGKDPSINEWTLINVTLPNEKIKIFIRLNNTVGPLAFDDISVDYCDGPRPSPPEVLYTCDFESSCSNDFVSLPGYPYQWSILEASDAVKIEAKAPPVDYTFGNQSGHYSLLPNSKIVVKGKVGYLHFQEELQITSNDSYCLNFEYYGYGTWYGGSLQVFSWASNDSKTVQSIWPKTSSSQYVYTTGQWTWGIINLPIGNYSLLFRVDSNGVYQSSYALDNIAITSCDYPSTELSPYNSILSFACSFDNMTMCDMINGDKYNIPTYNFSIFTGETIPNPELGPTRDHTTNSSSGGFLLWNRTLPYTARDFGTVDQTPTILQNTGMCIKFAYYVKSLAVNKNTTSISVSTGGCYSGRLWFQALDDSNGWQTAIVPVLNFNCQETFYFSVSQPETIEVSVAFDDIEIDQCSTLIPTTTTSTTTTTTTTTTITSTSTVLTTTTYTITISSSSSSSSSSSTTPIFSSTTTARSNAHRQFYLTSYSLIIFYILYQTVRGIVL